MVINFSDRSLEEAEEYDECMQIVRERVKPEREKLNDKGYREKWWQFGRRAVKLYITIEGLKRVLFHSFTSKYTAFGFVPTNIIYAAPHVVFAYDDYYHFAILQSVIHESWVREYTSYSLSLARYTPSDCFETFPLPVEDSLNEIACIGESFYIHRHTFMQQHNEGLTDIYNRFNNPEERNSDILTLREINSQMNIAVKNLYGWSDIDLNYDFVRTKDGIRFTISEKARHEVLQRLLKLNHESYEEEVRQGLHDKKKKKS